MEKVSNQFEIIVTKGPAKCSAFIPWNMEMCNDLEQIKGFWQPIDKSWYFRVEQIDALCAILAGYGYSTFIQIEPPKITYSESEHTDRFEVKSSYNKKILEILHSIPGYKWNFEKKTWEISTEHIPLFASKLLSEYKIPINTTHQQIRTYLK
jgi:hypothetical protein